MLFADAIAATDGATPIARIAPWGRLMLGYLDGSVDIVDDNDQVKRLKSGEGPLLCFTDWQPGKVLMQALSRAGSFR